MNSTEYLLKKLMEMEGERDMYRDMYISKVKEGEAAAAAAAAAISAFSREEALA